MSFTESGANVILEDTLFELFVFNPSPKIKLSQIKFNNIKKGTNAHNGTV